MAKPKKQDRQGFWPDHAQLRVTVGDRDGTLFDIFPGKQGEALYGFPDELSAQQKQGIEAALADALASFRDEIMNKVASFPKKPA
jgi:hypothetical protein